MLSAQYLGSRLVFPLWDNTTVTLDQKPVERVGHQGGGRAGLMSSVGGNVLATK